jgi:hypothetical protein
MTDPVKMLIDAGAITSGPFEPPSRYYRVPIGFHVQAGDEAPLPFVRRRFIPQLKDIALTGTVEITSRDRPELIAYRTFGEPLLYWRIADANGVTDPFELTDTAGERVAIPVPPGL